MIQPPTPSPWKDKRPPLKADDDSPDLSSPEGIERMRCLVARAIASGIVSRSPDETPASAATDGIADTVEHGEGQATPGRDQKVKAFSPTTVPHRFSTAAQENRFPRKSITSNKINTMSKPKAIRPAKPTPKFESVIGDPPAVLQGHALQVWNDTVIELKSAGIGTRVEANALSCYCQAIADFHAAQLEIDKHGLVIITERGAVKNPACTIKNGAMAQVLKFAVQFGLTPASRGRVAFTAPAEQNPFDLL